MSAETYLEEADQNDGRRTEAQLQQWFTVVDPASEMFIELNEFLTDFLSELGKAPSTAVRISVPSNMLKLGEQSVADPNAAIVDLILAVARALPTEHRNRLCAELRR
ncbi:hypothetical protein KXS07_31500 [Inquilinus limosus]|uniref:hypothetical protein n=1 Tax=Inquilinus limosus TaxID=171674 RepID=UPI003F13DE98